MDKKIIWNNILAERKRQDEKWGPIAGRTHEHMYWMTVLVEKIGEVAKAIWEVVSGRATSQAHIGKELIQCAAVIVAWMEDKF